MRKTSLWIAVLLVGAAVGARADIINFQSQVSASTSTWFDGTLDSPLAIPTASDTATFLGGELLNHQFLGVDQSVVYATESGSVYSDPLTINFATAVSGFSVDVTNQLSFDHTYVVTDNFGHSVSQVILFDHTTTFSLADTGITWVTISSLPTTGNWIYAIDNVQFNTSIPEPSTTMLVLFGIVGITAWEARRRKSA